MVVRRLGLLVAADPTALDRKHAFKMGPVNGREAADSGPSRGNLCTRTFRPERKFQVLVAKVGSAQIVLKNPLGRRERIAVARTIRAAE